MYHQYSIWINAWVYESAVESLIFPWIVKIIWMTGWSLPAPHSFPLPSRPRAPWPTPEPGSHARGGGPCPCARCWGFHTMKLILCWGQRGWRTPSLPPSSITQSVQPHSPGIRLKHSSPITLPAPPRANRAVDCPDPSLFLYSCPYMHMLIYAYFIRLEPHANTVPPV